jgi:ABC-type amino acid transport substrate-binding protein
LFVVGCNPKQNRHAGTDLFPNNTINVGFTSYPPGFIVDPNTFEKSGIFNDVLVEIARRNNLKINYKEEITWATLLEPLNRDRIDLIANPVWATTNRKQNADFSSPIYFSPMGVYVRADDDRFNDDSGKFDKINDPSVTIAGIDGELNAVIAGADYPKAKVKLMPNSVNDIQVFLEIQMERADVTFAEPMFAYDYMQKNPDKLKNIAEHAPVRNYPNSYMYKQGNEKLGEFLNREIENLLKDGTVDRIIEKYEPFKGAVISATDPRATERQ